MRQFISLAFVATAAAQMDMKALIGDLSPQCQAAAGGLMTSDFSTCSNMMGLVNILGAKGSLLGPINTWVDSVCSMAPCSPSVVSTATATVQAGCGADAKKGVPSAVEMTMLVGNYPAVRNAICLEMKSNHTRCASDLLATTEKVAGRPLTLAEVTGFLNGGVGSLAPALAKAPKDDFCNDCTHALTTVLSPSASMAMNSSAMASMPMNGTASKDGHAVAANVTAGVATMCGAPFADGKIPDSIAANNGGSSSSNGNNGGKSPANGAANSAANSVAVPIFASLAILGTATVFTALF